MPLMSASSQDPRRVWRDDTVFLTHIVGLGKWPEASKAQLSSLTINCQLTALGHKFWDLWRNRSALFCRRPEIAPEGKD